MRYRVVVFDWDGTLMDSEARIVDCIMLAADEAGLPCPTRAQARDIIGLGLADALARLFPGADEPGLQRLVERYRYHFLGDNQPRSVLFEGAEELVRRLAEQNYLLAVATGKSRQGLDKVLDETGLRRYFDSTRCADESGSKPNPQMLLDIMDRLGADPRDLVMIGDTEYDIEMAGHAKVDSVGVSWGVHDCRRLTEAGALTCLTELDQIEPWLNRV